MEALLLLGVLALLGLFMLAVRRVGRTTRLVGHNRTPPSRGRGRTARLELAVAGKDRWPAARDVAMACEAKAATDATLRRILEDGLPAAGEAHGGAPPAAPAWLSHLHCRRVLLLVSGSELPLRQKAQDQ
jgi:hypothetical protein